MNTIDFPIERINKYLDNHIFEVYLQPTHDEDYSMPTNVKVKLTGVKDYLTMGDKYPHVQYTIIILPTNKESDAWNKMWGSMYGKVLPITTSGSQYSELRWIMNEKLSDFLQYFGVEKKAICTEVVNELAEDNLNESLILEGKLDKLTRKLVQDVVKFFKHQRVGEFSLPEDLAVDDMVYTYPGFEGFTIDLNLQISNEVDTVDVDGELYYEDDSVVIKIISNPKAGYSILEELTQELNEVIRHELEHIKQHDEGYEFPEEEPENPEDYYTQQHELEAQRAGFNKRVKTEKADFESLVRNWFKKNPHKHTLKPNQQEKVIQQIINKNV
jgi:hypothetical protein